MKRTIFFTFFILYSFLLDAQIGCDPFIIVGDEVTAASVDSVHTYHHPAGAVGLISEIDLDLDGEYDFYTLCSTQPLFNNNNITQNVRTLTAGSEIAISPDFGSDQTAFYDSLFNDLDIPLSLPISSSWVRGFSKGEILDSNIDWRRGAYAVNLFFSSNPYQFSTVINSIGNNGFIGVRKINEERRTITYGWLKVIKNACSTPGGVAFELVGSKTFPYHPDDFDEEGCNIVNLQSRFDLDGNGCTPNDFSKEVSFIVSDSLSSDTLLSNSEGVLELYLPKGKYSITPMVEGLFQISPPSISVDFSNEYEFAGQEFCFTPIIVSSTDDYYLSKYRIYPNPSSDYIYVFPKSNEPLHVEIFDLKGSQLLSQNIVERVDVSNLSQGIYLVKLQNLQTGEGLIQKLTIIN